MTTEQKRLLNFLLKLGVVGFNPNGFTLKSGKTSFWYANFRNTTQRLIYLEQTADIVFSFLNSIDTLPKFDAILGVPEGGTLLGLELQRLAIKKNIVDDNIFSFRIKPKGHGDPANRF